MTEYESRAGCASDETSVRVDVCGVDSAAAGVCGVSCSCCSVSGIIVEWSPWCLW